MPQRGKEEARPYDICEQTLHFRFGRSVPIRCKYNAFCETIRIPAARTQKKRGVRPSPCRSSSPIRETLRPGGLLFETEPAGPDTQEPKDGTGRFTRRSGAAGAPDRAARYGPATNGVLRPGMTKRGAGRNKTVCGKDRVPRTPGDTLPGNPVSSKPLPPRTAQENRFGHNRTPIRRNGTAGRPFPRAAPYSHAHAFAGTGITAAPPARPLAPDTETRRGMSRNPLSLPGPEP